MLAAAPPRAALPHPLAGRLALARSPAARPPAVRLRAGDQPDIQALVGLEALVSAAALVALLKFWQEKKDESFAVEQTDAAVEEAFGRGQQVFQRELSRGSLFVTAHSDDGKATRVMRFRPAEGDYDRALLQSVVTVDVKEDGTVVQNGKRLPFDYTKTFVAVVLAVLQLLGCLKGDLRLLLIGLGGGTMASWLARRYPKSHIDVVELEPTVAEAAREAMGFRETENLHLSVADGVDFAQKAAKEGKAYDAVFVDAYDCDGNVPGAFTEQGQGLAKALEGGLLKESGVMAVNLVDVAGSGSTLATYGMALARKGPGQGFTVRECDPADGEGEGNMIAVRALGPALRGLDSAELQKRLGAAAKEVAETVDADFFLDKLAVRGFKGRAQL